MRKYTTEEVKNIVIKKGFELINNEYIGVQNIEQILIQELNINKLTADNICCFL